MRNGAKRFLSLVTALVTACTLMAAPAAAAAPPPDAPLPGPSGQQPAADDLPILPDTALAANVTPHPLEGLASGTGHTVGLRAATNASGQVTATVRLSAKAANEATGSDGAALLPLESLYAPQDIGKAPTVTVDTSGVNGVKVEVPLVNKGPGIVAVLVRADGTGLLIKNTLPTREGIAVRVNNGDTIRILDNRKPFGDIAEHWAADAVDFVSSRELFSGTNPNTFSPDAAMTQGMMMTVLARYENMDTEGGAPWYEKGAAWAVDKGLSDGTRLDDNITREQLAAIMYRYAILKDKLSGKGASLHGYADADRVSGWAADAMSWAVGVGLIKGITPKQLDPQGSATRAQAAAIIRRYAEMFGR